MVFVQSVTRLCTKNLSQAGILAVTCCLSHGIHQSVAEHHAKACTVCDLPQNATACDLTCLSHFQSLVFSCP